MWLIYNLGNINSNTLGLGLEIHKHHGQENGDQELSFNGRLHYYFFPLSTLRRNLPAVGNVDGLKKCALEDLFTANLCPPSVLTTRSCDSKASTCACPISTSTTSCDCLHQSPKSLIYRRNYGRVWPWIRSCLRNLGHLHGFSLRSH